MEILFENKFLKLTKYLDIKNNLYVYQLFDNNSKKHHSLFIFVCDLEGNPIKQKYERSLESINEFIGLYGCRLRKMTEEDINSKAFRIKCWHHSNYMIQYYLRWLNVFNCKSIIICG